MMDDPLASHISSYSLQDFTIGNIQLGKQIGRGANGRILEGKWEGAIVAVKEIHSAFTKELSEPEFQALETSFQRECRQSSRLCHPNIVRFLGIYYPPGSRIPSLVMERLLCSLTSLLEQNPVLQIARKLSIAHDVALGLRYLHTRTPIIIHRDLSSNNVLISKGMEGKICDLGTVHLVDSKKQSQMTKAPGTVDFMPPEALAAGESIKYERELDVFSFGCVMLHTLSHQWPTPSKPVVTDPVTFEMKAQSEVERRSSYFDKIDKIWSGTLIPMIESCLDNIPEKRASIVEVCSQLEVLIGDKCSSTNITDLSLSTLQEEIEKKDAEICYKNAEIEKNALIKNKDIQIQRQADEIEALKSKLQKINDVMEFKVNKSSIDFWNNLKLTWQQCADLPMKCYVTSVAELDGKVYIAITGLGNKGCYFDPLVYDSSKDRWSELPKLPHGGFSLVAVLHKKQLLAIGGLDDLHIVSNKVFAWDEQNRKWSTPYPNMPTARYHSSSISHGSTVIVAGGVTCSLPQTMTGVVEVLHIKERASRFSKSSWSVVERLPYVTREAVPLIINDNLLITVGCDNNDEGTCSIITASLSELLQSGSKKTTDGKVWHRLPDMPYSSWSINHYQGRLIIFNGDRKIEQSRLTHKSVWKVFKLIHLYNLDKMSWDCVGDDFHDYKLGKSVRIGKNKIFFIGGMTGGNFTVCREDDMVKTCSLLTLTPK